MSALDSGRLESFARLALDCITREYPYHLVHVMRSDDDVATPRRMNPAFYGCFDWHSAVHSHWLLVRLLHRNPGFAGADEALEKLAAHLTSENIDRELAYLRPRPGFERPYGLAWLLQLAAELREWNDALGNEWLAALAPLEELAAERLHGFWPKLPHPDRSGQHGQTAFALGLVLDWARGAGRDDVTASIAEHGRRFYLDDTDAPIRYEPSGHDFLSPALAEADVMRRLLDRAELSRWLATFLPGIPRGNDDGWLFPAVTSDRADGKLAHLDGLNLTRAWMLEGLAEGLGADDPRSPALRSAAAEHRREGIAAVTAEHYAGAHWLGSFAVYLETGRGLGTGDDA